MKDIDKLISGNADAYPAFKHTLESLPDGVVVIGSRTQADHTHSINSKKVTFHCMVFRSSFNIF